MGVEGRVSIVEICVATVEGESGWTCGGVDGSKRGRICTCTCCAEGICRGDVWLLNQPGMELEVWGSIGVCW